VRRPLVCGAGAGALWLGAARLDPHLAWLVCAPLVGALETAPSSRQSTLRAALLGASFTLTVALLGHGAWLADAAQRYFALAAAPAAGLAALLCIATALPGGAVLGLALRGAARLRGPWKVAGCAAVWVAFESAVRITFPYYPWVGLAATQAADTTVLQAASLAGSSGLSLLLAGCGCALGVAAARLAHRQTRAGAIVPIACAAAIAVGTAGFGYARSSERAAARDERCSVVAVDAAIESPAVGEVESLARYERVTARAARLRPDLVVWPESALVRDPLLDAALEARLRAVAAKTGARLLLGGPRTAWSPDWQAWRFNSLFDVPGTGPIGVYDKRVLVPFAETWPSALVGRPSWLDAADLRAGTTPLLLPAGACRVGVLICFEAERPDLARELAASGADAIVIASNDAELPPAAIATEVAEARLRAVETGLPVLRAANRGASLAIDRYGRDAGSTEEGLTALHVGPAKPAAAVHVAPVLLAICWLAAAAAVVTGARSGRPR
jgi:apolipoprotein N-acyltransferase